MGAPPAHQIGFRSLRLFADQSLAPLAPPNRPAPPGDAPEPTAGRSGDLPAQAQASKHRPSFLPKTYVVTGVVPRSGASYLHHAPRDRRLPDLPRRPHSAHRPVSFLPAPRCADPRQVRVVQPRRVGEGSRRPVDGPRRGEVRPAQARHDDPRATRGNTGIAYAMIGAALGYPVTLCVPGERRGPSASGAPARTAPMIGTPIPWRDRRRDPRGAAPCGASTRRGTSTPTSRRTRPTARAHYETTGPEILRTDGRRGDALRRRPRHQRYAHGRGPLPARRRAPPCCVVASSRTTPLHGLEGLKHMATALVPCDLRPGHGGRAAGGRDRGGAGDAPARGARGRGCGRASPPARRSTRRLELAAHARRARPSSPCCATGARATPATLLAGGRDERGVSGAAARRMPTRSAPTGARPTRTSAAASCSAPRAGGAVSEIARASNARVDSPANRYLIPPEEFVRVQRDADRRGLEIVGLLSFASGSSGAAVARSTGITRGPVTPT